MPTCHAYARVSSDKQENSLDAQAVNLKSIYRSRFEQQGYQWRGVYADEDFSGTLAWFSRPAGRKLLACLEPGDVILATKLDRFSRSSLDWHKLVKDVLPSLNVALKVGDLDLDLTTPHGRMIASMMITMAEYERDLASERTRVVLHHRRDVLGKWLGGPPMGWKVNRHGKLIPDVEWRECVDGIVREVDATGLGVYKLWQRKYRHERMPRKKFRVWGFYNLQKAVRLARKGWPLTEQQQRFTHAEMVKEREVAKPPH